MGLKLVLGVLDVAYSDANGSGPTTTGDVAETDDAVLVQAEAFDWGALQKLRKASKY